ncbi:MAG: sulfatase-like hydrolase/transferase [Candidatus Aminicenantaceae bacterium]
MDRNRPVVWIALCCALFSWHVEASPRVQTPNKTPEGSRNLLLVTIDTLRADRLSCYDTRHVQTPVMDSLSQQGVRFTRAFAHTPTTLPSHANILTGVLPLYHGVHDNGTFVLHEDQLTLAELLQGQGYATAAFVGAYPLDSRFGLAQGFERYDDDYRSLESGRLASVERKAEAVVEGALSWLKAQQDPWFLWVHCYDPHDPYAPPEPFRTQFAERPYDGEVAYVDKALGPLFLYLSESGLMGSTLVVLTGDHGESLGEHGEKTHGYLTYNSALWVPLIFTGPSIEPGTVNTFVSHCDIFPTVCDWLDIKRPGHLQGVSLAPALEGRSLKSRAIYFETLYPFYSRGWAPLRGYIVDGRQKYIESPIPELFDLEADFGETQDLISPRSLREHRPRLEQLIQRYTHVDSTKASQAPDRDTLAKLRTLGYIRAPSSSRSENREFGPSLDVKTLLPFHTKSTDAMEAYRGGDTRGAVRMLQEVLTKRQDIDVAYSNLAVIYKETGRLPEALEILRVGLQALPDSYEVFSAYLNFLINARQYSEVIRIFQDSSLRQMDTDPEIWNYLGVAYTHSREFDQAVLAFERSLELDPNYAVSHNNLGIARFSQALSLKEASLLEKALSSFQTAASLNPEYASPWNGLGIVYRQLGDLERAAASLERALELNPEYGDARYNLANIYLNRGDKARALQHFSLYKEKFQHALTPNEREKLEALIEQCKK